MSDWWQLIEDEFERHAASAPDPWADKLTDEPATLTDDQLRFLDQLAALHHPFLDPEDVTPPA
jgi:hypothetical protein